MRELGDAGRVPHGGVGEAWWSEHLRTDDLSVGTYVVPAGREDPQDPHTEDEIYVVVSGRGVLAGPDEEIAVAPGSVLFVGAGEEHRFERVEDDLVLIVVFGPAEGTRAAG